jgi:hypothetical protein
VLTDTKGNNKKMKNEIYSQLGHKNGPFIKINNAVTKRAASFN